MRNAGIVPAACLVVCATGLAEALHVTGNVVDEAGTLIADAEVWAAGPGRGEPVWTRSARKGTFRLDVEAGPQTGWQVLATAPGLATAAAQGAPGNAGPVELKLGLEAMAHGRVLDEEGRPVVGADVRLCFASGPSPIHYQTDAEGRFTLGHVARDAEARIRVEAPGLLTWTSDQTRARAIGGMVQEYVIHLVPPSRVEGTVTHNGQPAAGVEVYALETPPPEWWGPPVHLDRTLTDADGHYRLAGLRPGTSREATTDGQGRAVIGGLSCGSRYALCVCAPDNAGLIGPAVCAEFTPEPDRDRDLGDVRVPSR